MEGFEKEKVEGIGGKDMEGSKRQSSNRGASIYMVAVFSIAISVLSGMASGWYFSRTNHREVVVLDVAKIIDEKKKEFIEKYKDRNDPRLKEEMEKDISSFMDRLNQVIGQESVGRIVLVKDSVISEAEDITDEVEAKIKKLARKEP